MRYAWRMNGGVRLAWQHDGSCRRPSSMAGVTLVEIQIMCSRDNRSGTASHIAKGQHSKAWHDNMAKMPYSKQSDHAAEPGSQAAQQHRTVGVGQPKGAPRSLSSTSCSTSKTPSPTLVVVELRSGFCPAEVKTTTTCTAPGQ